MGEDSENTDEYGETRRADGRFGAGNPGKPKGSRNALGEAFLSDLQKTWKEHGEQVLLDAKDESPVQFAKMVAGLLPKELLVRKAPEDEMTDDELADTLEALRDVAEQLRGSNSETGKSTGETPRLQ